LYGVVVESPVPDGIDADGDARVNSIEKNTVSLGSIRPPRIAHDDDNCVVVPVLLLLITCVKSTLDKFVVLYIVLYINVAPVKLAELKFVFASKQLTIRAFVKLELVKFTPVKL
jgi:hypothetical protein